MKFISAMIIAMVSVSVFAEQVPIVGSVESRCIVITDTDGIYGNPTPSELSTAPADGGVLPIIRFDVLQADFYKAVITHPNGFTESPSLDDTVTWSGSTSVTDTSDANMSSYDTNKVTYNNSTEYDLTVAGSTWFSVSSEADYGYSKAFPPGTYRAMVEAECIAQ